MYILRIVLLVVALNTTVMAQDRPPLHPTEQRLVDQTNAERVRHGLPSLAVDPTLMNSSRRHGIWMSTNGQMRHSSGPYSENIACGQRTVREAIRSWMNSRGHRANILGRHKRLGVSAYYRKNGSIYWCQQFK